MSTLRFAVVTALACAWLVGAPPASAIAADGEFTFGTQWWDQSARDAKYQEFREVPRGAFLEDFVLREWSGRTSLELWGANAIRKDQVAHMSLSHGARWRFDLGYTQIPHLFSHVARWGWRQGEPGVFSLPDSLQARNQAIPSTYTQRMADYLSTAPHVDLGFGTDVTEARLRARPVRGWTLETRSALRHRTGLKPYGFSFGFNTALENPEPIDQRMIDADVIAGYQRSGWSAQADLGVSQFDNGIGALRVDNPKRIIDAPAGDGPAVGQMDLYPDNRVLRGTMAIAYRLTGTTALGATFGVARGTQDDDFLPFTINSALPQSNPDSLPATNLDAKTLQWNGDVRLTSRPMKNLDGTLRVNHVDYDNQTDELNFIGMTPYESGWQRFIELKNHIESHQRTVAGLDLGYALTPQVRLGGLAEYRMRERTAREVEKDNETVLGARTRIRLMDGLQVGAGYTHGDREAEDFDLEEYFGLKTRTAAGSTPGLYDSLGLLEQPGLRRYDVADRVQDLAQTDLSWALGERLDLSVGYGFLKNDFASDTLLGLREEKSHSVSSAATWHWSERLDVEGGYGLNLVETLQRSRSSGASLTFTPDSNWTAKVDEEEVYVFAGFDWSPLGKLGLGVDYQFSRNISRFDLDNGLHNAADLPEVVFRRHELLLEARWRWLEHTTLLGRWGWEEYDTDDWATTRVPLIFPTTGTANAIFLGDSSLSYRAHRVALLVRHVF